MNWLRRKNGKEKHEDQDSVYSGFAVAVAAAAFAIHSLEEARTLHNKNTNQTQDSMAKLSHSNQVSSRFSFKKTKNGETPSKSYSSGKSTRSSSNKLKESKGDRRKPQRNDKLRSILAWATARKMEERK